VLPSYPIQAHFLLADLAEDLFGRAAVFSRFGRNEAEFRAGAPFFVFVPPVPHRFALFGEVVMRPVIATSLPAWPKWITHVNGVLG